MSGPDVIATAAVAASVDALLAMTDPAILVRSPPGGGARTVVTLAAQRLEARGVSVNMVPALATLDDAGLLSLRRQVPGAVFLAATEVEPDRAAVATLLQYLQPRVHRVAPLTMDEIARVREAAGPGPARDEDTAAVLRWTGGLADDVADVARHVRGAHGPTADVVTPEALTGFAPSAERRASWPDASEPGAAALWALATAAGVDELDLEPPAADARRVDAHALLATLTAAQRMQALQAALALVAQRPAADLAPESLLAVGSWWCEVDGANLRADELGHLATALQLAFRRNRFTLALPMADRLWRTTKAELAGVALAAALSRSTPDDPGAGAWDELATVGSADIDAALRVTRATWLFHLEGRPDEALALLDAGAAPGTRSATDRRSPPHTDPEPEPGPGPRADRRPDARAATHAGPRADPHADSDARDPRDEARGARRAANVRDALATLELHRGRPDAVERRLTATRVAEGADEPSMTRTPEASRVATTATDRDDRDDRDDGDDEPTAFGVNALVLADLVRGRHRRAADRLGRELERRLDPGPNLSVDRYRFYRAVAATQAGWRSADATADLDRAYVQALEDADDWTRGWIGWGSGVQAARAGRFRTARRRLDAAAAAFTRAHRPGFAMWPQSAGLELAALTDPAFVGADHPIAFDHAVIAERSAAQLARAHAARATSAPTAEVGQLLREAMQAAHDTHEVVTSYLVAIERLLAGLDLDHPIDDPFADGVLVDVWPMIESGDATQWDAAGAVAIERGWVVLGVRLRGAAAARLRRRDARAATRIRQEVRTVTQGFEGVLQPWALEPEDLPTLSAREMEVARAIAGGASRDELAARLVVSRRTIDSHLQRVYSKLGVTSRAELRVWLDGT